MGWDERMRGDGRMEARPVQSRVFPRGSLSGRPVVDFGLFGEGENAQNTTPETAAF